MDERNAHKADPITVELVRERMITIVREMRGNMLRAAFSSAVCELHDMSCAILSADGELIALSEGDNPQHVFPIIWSIEQVLQRFGSDIHPGDIFLHNDPLTGGTHLNDIGMIAPLFMDGELAYFPVVRVHFEDVGGASPGSVSASATNTYQEGIRIPALRAYSRGERNRALFDVLLSNMRVPHEREGDFEAMLGTCRVAQRRLNEVAADFDFAVQKACIAEMLDRAEERMRTRIRTMPNGTYSYSTAMDPRGAEMEPLVIRAAVKIAEDSIHVDFAGTSPQNFGPWNLGPAGAPTGVFMVLKALLDRTGAVNSGTFRPLTIDTPPGSILNPTVPVGFGGMGDVRRNLEMAIMGALASLMPDDVTGETKSTANQMLIAGRNAVSGRDFIFYEAPPGGTGGFKQHDGNSALRTFLEGDFGSLQSVEAIEAKFPLQVEELALRCDSAGIGEHRGGLGFRRQIRVLAEGATLTVLSDRNVLPPYGVYGGGTGSPNRFYVRRGDETIVPGDIPGKIANYPLLQNDLVVSESSGGGGYGDPLARSTALVRADVTAGYVSATSAANVYGVVFAGQRADEARTKAKRKTLAAARVECRLTARRGLPAYGSLLVCIVPPAVAKKGGLKTGDVAEILNSSGAPVRCWIAVDRKQRGNNIAVAPENVSLAGLHDRENVLIRKIAAPAGVATKIWKKRLEKVL